MGGDSVDDVDLFVRVIDSFMNRYMRRVVLIRRNIFQPQSRIY